MPTCLEIAGATYPASYRGREILPVEGKSLLPAFRGESIPRPEGLFWELNGARAVRLDDWKLVATEDGPWELYNLAKDRAEQKNVAMENPDRVATLTALYTDWSRRCNEGR